MLKRLGNEETNTRSVGNYENLEEGEYEARLVYVGDLGLIERNFNGEEKPPAQQLALGLELVDSTVMIDGIEQPRLIWSKPFNIFSTLNEKGKEIEMYRVFDSGAKEGEVADWDSALGQPCNATIVHRIAADGAQTKEERLRRLALLAQISPEAPRSALEGVDVSEGEFRRNIAML